MNKDKVDSSKCGVSSKPATEPSCPSISIAVDEYGRPIIQGTYSGQSFANEDALTPGRQVEEAQEAEEEEKSVCENQRESTSNASRNRSQALVVIGAIFVVWMVVAGVRYRSAADSAPKTASADVGPQQPKQQSDLPAPHQAQAMPAATVNQQSNEPMSEQQALNTVSTLASQGNNSDPRTYVDALRAVSTKDGATMLLTEADQLAQNGKTDLAALLYRRALQVYAISCGPLSPEYHQTLLKLACMFHSTKRFAEEQEINDLISRQSQSALYSQSLH